MLLAYLTLYALGGAVLALWADLRCPGRPGFGWRLLAHLIAVMALSGPLMILANSASAHAARVLDPAGLFLHARASAWVVLVAALLVLGWMFLVGLWILRAALDRMGGGGGGIPAKVKR